ncbi:hypothetical protein [Chryseobacterium sp. P1-3]|nr:hypothetical protein [Chryseobacterium sp. P1-3]
MDTPNYRMPFVPSTLMTEGGSIDTCDMGGKHRSQYHAADHHQKR